jgi:hypothetical protein
MTYEAAQAFMQALETNLVADGNTLNVTARKAFEEDTSAHRAMSNVIATGAVYTSFLNKEGAWMDVQLPPGKGFVTIHKNDVVDSLKGMEVQVYRGARLQVKIPKPVEEGEPEPEVAEMVPMGTGAMTDRLNFVVKPMHTTVVAFSWPPFIAVKTKSGETFQCKYRLGGEGAKLLHSTYNGCKGLLADCPGNCGVSVQWDKGTGGDLQRSNPGKEAAAKRKARSDEGQSIFMEQVGLKPELECKHFSSGKCVRGRKCGNMHGGGNHIRDGSYVKAWEDIPCNLQTNASGWCKAQPNCVYQLCASLLRTLKDEKRLRKGEASSSNSND